MIARRTRRLLPLGILVLGVAVLLATRMGARAAEERPVVVLISLDGFAARFLDSAITPTLARLAREGVHAPEGMVPIFPTKTFPNHYTIVTGLYAEHHGIVSNSMYDPAFDATFSLGDRDAVTDGRWWEGEPIWVTAERQGQVAAAFFWPGTDAPIHGVRPTYWRSYDGGVPNAARVDQVLAWLALPEAERPQFVTLYFSDVDGEVHDHGTDAPEARAAMAQVDRAVGRLVEGLRSRGQLDAVNLVIVSDHGMANTSSDRVLFLDDAVDLSRVRVSDWNPVAAVWPEGDVDPVYRALVAASDRWSVYRKADIPARYHYRDHRRIPPIVVVADEGWSIARRRGFRPEGYEGATHGWDNQLPSMRAVFIARGPAFKTGLELRPFENVHLYELLCSVLGLTPASNDGRLDSVQVVLRTGKP